MDKRIMNMNVGFFYSANRLFTGSLMLLVMMITPDLPVWMLFVPLYPILTAIAAWDPLYAIFTLACQAITEKLSYKGSKLALG